MTIESFDWFRLMDRSHQKILACFRLLESVLNYPKDEWKALRNQNMFCELRSRNQNFYSVYWYIIRFFVRNFSMDFVLMK